MMKDEIEISITRVKQFFKKNIIFLLLFVLVVTLLSFVWTKFFRSKDMNQTYTATTIVQLVDNNKYLYKSAITMENIIAYIKTDECKEALKKETKTNKDVKLDESFITISRINGSDFITINIFDKSKKDALRYSHSIIDIIKKNILKYDDNIQLKVIDDSHIIEETDDLDHQGNIFIIIASFILASVFGLLFIILRAIFSKTIVCPHDLELVMEYPPLMIVDSNNKRMYDYWIKNLEDNCTVLISSVDLTHDIYGHRHLTVEQFISQISSHEKNEKLYFVVKAWDLNIMDIENILNICEMLGIKIEGYLFFEK